VAGIDPEVILISVPPAVVHVAKSLPTQVLVAAGEAATTTLPDASMVNKESVKELIVAAVLPGLFRVMVKVLVSPCTTGVMLNTLEFTLGFPTVKLAVAAPVLLP
jgi:hypothetical protein